MKPNQSPQTPSPRAFQPPRRKPAHEKPGLQSPIRLANDTDASPTTVTSEHPSAEEGETAARQDDTPTAAKSPYIPGSGGYNALKSFNGQVYSGMAVGGSHTWNYDQGVWKETKTEPDLWKIDFETTKRRAKNAPEGSGAAVGTEYHWLIVAHQYVKKVDANTYTTHLTGSKYKLAHKGASSASWSIPTVKAQRDQEVNLLEDARRRIEGLPPVTTGERVKVERVEKGQQKLEALFAKAPESPIEKIYGKKRKREDQEHNQENEENVEPKVKALKTSERSTLTDGLSVE